MQVWGCGNVEEGGSFANEFRSRRRLGIEIGIKVLGEDVEEVNDAVSHGVPDILSWMRRFFEFFGKNGAVAIRMAGAQSVRMTVKDS